MTTPMQTAYKLFLQYKTQTPQYKALCAQLGYASAGDLNRCFATHKGQKA